MPCDAGSTVTAAGAAVDAAATDGCPCMNPRGPPTGTVAPIPGSTNPAERAACPGVASPNCPNADAAAPASPNSTKVPSPVLRNCVVTPLLAASFA